MGWVCTQLAGTSAAPTLELLKLFAYGTWMDYKASESSLPALSAEQTKKLKKLTVVSLASQRKIVPYDVLMRELGVSHASVSAEEATTTHHTSPTRSRP